jgi:hypothetical protein
MQQIDFYVTKSPPRSAIFGGQTVEYCQYIAEGRYSKAMAMQVNQLLRFLENTLCLFFDRFIVMLLHRNGDSQNNPVWRIQVLRQGAENRTIT